MEKIHDSNCDICKKERDDLYSIETYWTPAINKQYTGNAYRYTYNMNDKRAVKYKICSECVKSNVKVNKILKYVAGIFGLLFAGVLPIAYFLEEVFGVNINSGVESPGLPLFLFVVFLLIAYFTFRKPDIALQEQKTLNGLALNKLIKDISKGAAAPEFFRKNINLYKWTELKDKVEKKK